MKMFKIALYMTIMPFSLLGYRIDYQKTAFPADKAGVDIYVYKADSPAQAMERHKSYVSTQGIPDNIVNILDKVRGISAPITTALATPTEGISLIVQGGLDITADTWKVMHELFGRSLLQELIGRIHRGDIDALHENVLPGNNGKGAEWNTDQDMYAIVTAHRSLVPLNQEPYHLAPHTEAFFSIDGIPDPANPGNKIFTAAFRGSSGRPITIIRRR